MYTPIGGDVTPHRRLPMIQIAPQTSCDMFRWIICQNPQDLTGNSGAGSISTVSHTPRGVIPGDGVYTGRRDRSATPSPSDDLDS